MPRQFLITEELHANVNDAVGHGVRLVTLHEGLHDEGIVLYKCFNERDLWHRRRKSTLQILVKKKIIKILSWTGCTSYTLCSGVKGQ